GAIPQQTIDQFSDPLDLLWGVALITRVRNRDITQSSALERPHAVETLVPVLRARDKPPVIEELQSERADIRMQPPGLGQEQTLAGIDRRVPLQQPEVFPPGRLVLPPVIFERLGEKPACAVFRSPFGLVSRESGEKLRHNGGDPFEDRCQILA